MKYIGRLLGWILLGVNGLVVLLFFLSAYSPYINPQEHPLLSCIGLAFPIFLLFVLLFFFFWLLIYRRYTLLSLLAVVCCWNAVCTYIPINCFAEERPGQAIKFLSYNTMAFGLGERHTQESPNATLAYMAASNADIICIQECIWMGKINKKEVDYALRSYKYKHYYSIYDGLNGLACYSKYPILSAKPIKYGSKLNGSIAYRIKVGEDTLLVVNNHLESNKIAEADKEVYENMMNDPSKQNLKEGSRLLLKKVAEASAIRSAQADTVAKIVRNFKGQGVIVCGDFNDSPISYSHRILSEYMKDAFVESGNGLGISYNRNRFYFRIDHILASKNLKAYECTVDRTIKASDHYPIWCYISLK